MQPALEWSSQWVSAGSRVAVAITSRGLSSTLARRSAKAVCHCGGFSARYLEVCKGV